jgi:hypothetical protein
MSHELEDHCVISLFEGDSRKAWIGYGAIASIEMAGHSYVEIEARLNSQESTVTDFMLLIWAAQRTFDKSLSFDDFVLLLDVHRTPFERVKECVLQVIETMGAGLYSVASDGEKLADADGQGDDDDRERGGAASVASFEAARV